MNRGKKLSALFLACTTAFSLVACGGSSGQERDVFTSEEEKTSDTAGTTAVAQDGSWSIYWYLCGSDLESGGGFATGDLSELMEVTLPENVNVVIETGGASAWQNEVVDASKLQRWLYNSEGLQLLEEQPTANMGDAKTLEEFLSFAAENYPAEKTAVVFWNHGGGSVAGAAFDELYGGDSLTLDEMYAAFSSVWDPSESSPALELVGFDTCLMATVDVAYTFSDLARYLVASEETEPANGWYYSQWVGELAKNPAMGGEELGKIICDAYYAGCEAVGTQDNTTLSLTDLSKTGPLLEAYESFGAEALLAASENPSFFSQFARVAQKSENYGGNTKEQGYSNMVDLGHMARQSAGMLDSSQSVLDALKQCVIYQVGGKYRTEATGLSCYYSYDGNVDNFKGYAGLGAGEAFKHFYAYELTGKLDDLGMQYLADRNVETLPEVKNLLDMKWGETPLDIDDQGRSFLNLGPEANDILAGVAFCLYYEDPESDTMMLLGSDNDMERDWENGIFYDNFRGVWGSIDGYFVYMELTFDGEGYNLYSAPILLNGEEYNLQVFYDFTTEEWGIMGARRSIDENGMADKEMRQLQAGDEITTLWYVSADEDDDFEPYEAETFKVTENTVFEEKSLPDGSYIMLYQMWDAMDNCDYSSEVYFNLANGEIMTSLN